MKKLLILIVAMFNILGVAAPATVFANDAKDAVCSGVGLASGTSGCQDKKGETTVNSIIATAINLLSFVVGIAAVIVIIISGLRFVTSSGDPQKVSSARDGILYAIVGIVVALLAQVIVKFVLSKAS